MSTAPVSNVIASTGKCSLHRSRALYCRAQHPSTGLPFQLETTQPQPHGVPANYQSIQLPKEQLVASQGKQSRPARQRLAAQSTGSSFPSHSSRRPFSRPEASQLRRFEVLWLEHRKELQLGKRAAADVLDEVAKGRLPCDSELLLHRGRALLLLDPHEPRLRLRQLLTSFPRAALAHDPHLLVTRARTFAHLLPEYDTTLVLTTVLPHLERDPYITAMNYRELDELFGAAFGGARVPPSVFAHLLRAPGASVVRLDTAALLSRLRDFCALFGRECAYVSVQRHPQLLDREPRDTWQRAAQALAAAGLTPPRALAVVTGEVPIPGAVADTAAAKEGPTGAAAAVGGPAGAAAVLADQAAGGELGMDGLVEQGEGGPPALAVARLLQAPLLQGGVQQGDHHSHHPQQQQDQVQGQQQEQQQGQQGQQHQDDGIALQWWLAVCKLLEEHPGVLDVELGELRGRLGELAEALEWGQDQVSQLVAHHPGVLAAEAGRCREALIRCRLYAVQRPATWRPELHTLLRGEPPPVASSTPGTNINVTQRGAAAGKRQPAGQEGQGGGQLRMGAVLQGGVKEAGGVGGAEGEMDAERLSVVARLLTSDDEVLDRLEYLAMSGERPGSSLRELLFESRVKFLRLCPRYSRWWAEGRARQLGEGVRDAVGSVGLVGSGRGMVVGDGRDGYGGEEGGWDVGEGDERLLEA